MQFTQQPLLGEEEALLIKAQGPDGFRLQSAKCNMRGGRGVLRLAEAPQCVQATLSSHEHHERSDGAGEAERRQRWETRRSSG